MKRTVLPFLLALLAAGCATRPGSGSDVSADVLTVEDIQEVPAYTAFEVVQRLRPHWLRPRTSPTVRYQERVYPKVYVDGLRRGEVAVLRDLRRENVVRIEYLGPSDATSRFGTNHGGGAILVTTG